MTTPETFSIDDGYGVIGSGWHCGKCEHVHMFESWHAGEDKTCNQCGVINHFEQDDPN
jgi:hypothetical protein